MKAAATVRVALVSALAGCVSAGGRAVTAAPLDVEGELLVQLSIPEASSVALDLELDGVDVVQPDGTLLPLRLERTRVSGAAGERFLASGRLEPGSYAGVAIRFASAALDTPRGRAALVVPAAPSRVEAPFGIQRRLATVLLVELDLRASIQGNYSLAPALVGSIPPKTVNSLVGIASDPRHHRLYAFDRRAHRLTGVLPTGREPSGVSLDEVAGRAFVTLSGDDEVAVLDLASFEELARIRLQPGDRPGELGLTPDRALLVVINSGSSTVSFVDTASWTETSRLRIADGPETLLIDPQGVRAYVTHGPSNRLSVIDLALRSLVRTLTTEDRPLRPRLDRTGRRLFLAHAASGHVSVLSLPGFALEQRLYVGLGATAIHVDPATDHLYVANGAQPSLSVYDTASLMPIDRTTLPGPVSELWLDGADNTFVALLADTGTLLFLEKTTRRAVAALELPAAVRLIAISGGRER